MCLETDRSGKNVKILKKWKKALLAFVCSFIMCNLLCMAYESG